VAGFDVARQGPEVRRRIGAALAFACALGLLGLLVIWAVTGLRRAERGE
jgi:hypothetical protein